MTDCQHQVLFFTDGSFHLTCGHCGYSWAAVGHDPNDQLDHTALTQTRIGRDERKGPFYIQSLLRSTRVNEALGMLKVTTSPLGLSINLGEVTEFLYGNPQWELLKSFEEKVLPFYIGRPSDKRIMESLLGEARSFLKNAVMTYIPR